MTPSAKARPNPLGVLRDKLFVNPSDIGQAYNRVSAHYEQYFWPMLHQYNDRLLDHLLPLLPKRDPLILDLACGSGYNSYYIRQQLPEAALLLMDISQGMLVQAKKRVTPPVLYYHGDMLEGLYPFPAQSFDAIVCCWALKYHRPHAVIAQCARVLRPGGYLAVMLNTKDTLPEIRSAYFKLLVKNPWRINKVMMPLPNPINRHTFDCWFWRAGLTKWASDEGEHCFSFKDSEKLTEFITSTGALAGYDRMLDLGDPGLKAQLTALFAQSQPYTATHRFVWGIYQKTI